MIVKPNWSLCQALWCTSDRLDLVWLQLYCLMECLLGGRGDECVCVCVFTCTHYMCVWSIYSPIHVLIFSTYLFLFKVKGRSEPIPACILYRQANIFLKNIFGSPWGRTCYWVLDSLYEQKRNMSVVGQVKVLSSKNVITFCPLSAALQVQHRGQCLIITAGPRLWIIKRTSGSIQFHNKGSGMNAGQQNVLRTIILSLLVNMGLHSSGVYLPCVSSVKGKRDIIRIHNHWVSLCVCLISAYLLFSPL